MSRIPEVTLMDILMGTDNPNYGRVVDTIDTILVGAIYTIEPSP